MKNPGGSFRDTLEIVLKIVTEAWFAVWSSNDDQFDKKRNEPFDYISFLIKF